jgi:integrase/recombinase XerC
MLHSKIKHFIQYCQVSNFSKRSIETLSTRLNEFNRFISSESISNLSDISYKNLQEFVADFKGPSVHAKKSRVWALHQFFHFLKLNHWIDENIALGIPYPKMEKTVPRYLTPDEYNQLLSYFYQRADSAFGLRNLCLIMCFGFLGLRLKSIIFLDREDIDLESGLAAVKEKGGRKRTIVLPKALSDVLELYLVNLGKDTGPLFLSKRNKRIHERTLQDIFRSAADHLGIEKRLHAHLFRHTAATHLNKVAGVEITQFVLGHTQRSNTVKYTHLNPDEYAQYMKKHPFMNL